MSAFAQESAVPEWVRNTALWWAQGKISDTEYFQSIEFLINKGIIRAQPQYMVEINPLQTDFTAIDVVPETERAKAFRITFYGGDHFAEPLSITTYSQFQHFSRAVHLDNFDISRAEFSLNPVFSLYSLPSDDKQPIYDLVTKYVKPGAKPRPFEVHVEVLNEQREIIQQWSYFKCDIVDYTTYVDNNKRTYRFTTIEGPEIRDATIFKCSGYTIETPTTIGKFLKQ